MADSPSLAQQAEAVAKLFRIVREPLAIAASYDVDGETVGIRLHARDCKKALAALDEIFAALQRVQAETTPLLDAVDYVLRKFNADEAQGYRSRDRQFAIEILGPAALRARVSQETPK